MALTYHNNNSISNVTSFAQVPSGSPVLLSTATASGSSSISFTSGIDSTYDIYQFEFNSIHPATDNVNFTVNFSTDGGSNYNVTKTTTTFIAYHIENDTASGLQYEDRDIAQGTGYQQICPAVGADNDQHSTGYLQLFNPSSTTYVKHFISRTSSSHNGDYAVDFYTAGYGNTTSAINAISFKFSSGNIDAGTIKMYGIKA